MKKLRMEDVAIVLMGIVTFAIMILTMLSFREFVIQGHAQMDFDKKQRQEMAKTESRVKQYLKDHVYKEY